MSKIRIKRGQAVVASSQPTHRLLRACCCAGNASSSYGQSLP